MERLLIFYTSLEIYNAAVHWEKPTRPPLNLQSTFQQSSVSLLGDLSNSTTIVTPAKRAKSNDDRLGDSFPNLARCRQRADESLDRVLNVRGRPAVCKRRLVAAARGPQTTPGGVGRLRTHGAAVWRALGQFGTAVAAGGHGGRTAASGGKHTCVCRRIRCPFLVLRTWTSWLSKRYLSPPSQDRPLPKAHAASTRAAPAPFRTAISAGI